MEGKQRPVMAVLVGCALKCHDQLHSSRNNMSTAVNRSDHQSQEVSELGLKKLGHHGETNVPLHPPKHKSGAA